MLQLAAERFAGQPVDVVAHSFGGCAVGLAPSGRQVRRVVMVGAQFAYWRDYAANERWRLVGKWHVVMPLLTRLCGYFPGKRLGWMEDTPAGVVHDWTTRTPRYEHRPSGRTLAQLPFAQVQAATLAISLTDDPFGTVAATERLLGYLQHAERRHLRLAPGDISVAQIGHFAFFHDRFRETLWPIALAWLQQGRLPESSTGTDHQLRWPGPQSGPAISGVTLERLLGEGDAGQPVLDQCTDVAMVAAFGVASTLR